MTWVAQVLTLFPEMFPGALGHSLAEKALRQGLWSLETIDIRAFATDRHRTVDGSPAGGGAGMVMRADILAAAIDKAHEKAQKHLPLIYLSPRGQLFDQAKAQELKEAGGVTLICGRFEGVDERVLEARGVEELSVGDYVLSGGEPAALVVMDAVIRLLPGVMGDADGLEEESFKEGLLEYPHFTRPQDFEGHQIPEVLTSGNHGKVKEWRREKAEEITRLRRPDLWAHYKAPKDRQKK
jgi:tRNA (guanine37-N1)-methyltransferase